MGCKFVYLEVIPVRFVGFHGKERLYSFVGVLVKQASPCKVFPGVSVSHKYDLARVVPLGVALVEGVLSVSVCGIGCIGCETYLVAVCCAGRIGCIGSCVVGCGWLQTCDLNCELVCLGRRLGFVIVYGGGLLIAPANSSACNG
ncbi:hypothetical protein SDC9_129030 [bioreactor metagenome]|uniref:Uncharacterized protein n=1 Tax=bioreactor metagenome TaxID=1076179 RepID=A0A645CZH2_9ZZZZ